jgi:transglutaminase-like putative cysteine protease
MKGGLIKAIALLIVVIIILLVVLTRSTYRMYDWEYEGHNYEIYAGISESSYGYYAGQNIARGISSSNDYSYVTNFITTSDATITEIVGKLMQIARDAGMSSHELLSLTLAFVQSIPYSYDLVTYGVDDYWAYPVETLHRNQGDCEDKSFLFGTLVEAMGLDAVILMDSDHAAVGVDDPGVNGTYFLYEGVKYYYCETTEVGYEIGDPLPDGFDSAHVVQI